MARAQRWPGATHAATSRDDTVSAGHRRSGVVRPDDLAAVPVIDADNPIEVTCNDRAIGGRNGCLLYTSPSPRDSTLSRMPSSA